jgi:hypothetical protein
MGDAVREVMSRALDHRYVGEVCTEMTLMLNLRDILSVLKQAGQYVLTVGDASF